MDQTNKPQQDKPPQEDDKRGYFRWLGIGVEFCGVLGVFCYIGFKIDERFGTSPLFLIISFFFAFTGMFYLILKETRDIWRK
jgi:F0F1-type ATP synthase assembly protein I